eukprot:8432851-Pyramimonas_sp.AAC.3
MTCCIPISPLGSRVAVPCSRCMRCDDIHARNVPVGHDPLPHGGGSDRHLDVAGRVYPLARCAPLRGGRNIPKQYDQKFQRSRRFSTFQSWAFRDCKSRPVNRLQRGGAASHISDSWGSSGPPKG